MNWTKEKPTFTEDCIVITAKWWESGQTYEYFAYRVIYKDKGGYWECFDLDGWYKFVAADLKGDYYMVVPMIKK